MKLLSSLARALVRKDFVESLRNAASAAEVVDLVEGVVNPAPAARRPPHPRPPHRRRRSRRRKTLVAITACPTGIAHTYMAADSLVAAAQGGRRRRCTSRRRAPRAARRCPPRPSPAPTPSSSPPTSASRTAAGSRASPSSPPASSAPSTSPPRWSPKPLPQRTIRMPPASRAPQAHRPSSGALGVRRRRLGHPHPPDPAHRRQLHDPVRRRGRSADRARLPVRRLRHRQQARRRDAVARQHHRHAPTR